MTYSTSGLRVGAMLCVSATLLAGCLGSGSSGAGAAGGGAVGAAVATPVNNLQGSGRIIARSFAGTTTFTPAGGQPGVTRTRTSSVSNAQTAAGGGTLAVTVDDDPGSTDDADVLLTSTNTASLGGSALPDFTNNPAQLQLTNGRFGDPFAITQSAVAGDTVIVASGISRLNAASGTIDLDDVTLVRYDAGTDQTGTENIVGVGYYGDLTPVANVPVTATFRAALEPGAGDVFIDPNATGTISINAGGAFEVAIDGSLNGTSASGPLGFSNTNPNANVTGLRANGTLVGAEVIGGTAAFVDAGGVTVGTVRNSDLVGGVFGATGEEAAAALMIEGTMDINGNPNTDYFYSAVILGER